MDKTSYLDAVRRDADAFVLAAQRGLDVPVPSCPDWSVRDLVVHLGNVYGFWTAIVRDRLKDEDEVRQMINRLSGERDSRANDPSFAQPAALFDWFGRRAEELRTTLGEVHPDEPIWTWFPPQQYAEFVPRRMAHETAVHRWDAQLAHDCTEPIDAELARDGIDEMLDVHLPGLVAESPTRGQGESYHFHRTDGDGEWLVRFGPEGEVVSREHARADVAVRGTSSDLLLFLWNRIPAVQLEVLGDASLLSRYFDLAPPE